jgi:RNA polymerase sigma-70 factor (ECF subfamily)
MALEPSRPAASDRDRLYEQAVATLGPALTRIARSSEQDRHKQEELLQDIHLALWRSLHRFDGACALGTWVYRVAHNTAASYVLKDRRQSARRFISLDALAACDEPAHADDPEEAAARRLLLDDVAAIVRRLHPLDRQVLLLYLEGLEATAIGEVTGLSASNVATKVHRIKKILKTQLGGAGGAR